MKKFLPGFFIPFLMIGGCATNSVLPSTPESEVNTTEVAKTAQPEQKIQDGDLVLPIAEYGERSRHKVFGEYIQDRFKGYHVGDDIEYAEESKEVPVLAIADGAIAHIRKVDGYGGLVIVKYSINGKTFQAQYGHLDLSSTNLKKDDNVTKGQFLANLGKNKSKETDGERKHLHFGLYEGDEIRLQGYESSAEKVALWINPYDFFLTNGVNISKKSRSFEPDNEVGGNIFGIQFTIPEGWEVEYIPSLKALNLFTLSGTGTARARSQMLIRYFDAKDFLTLSTVTVHGVSNLKIGTENYTARRYDIEKKLWIADFTDQPAWRNKRHIVTDFRGKDGFTRYYVVAANPALDVNIYESVLASMAITKDF